jgi:hypothetical protein
MTYIEAFKRLWFSKTSETALAWLIYIAPFILVGFTEKMITAPLIAVALYFVVPLFVRWSVSDIEKREANGEFD